MELYFIIDLFGFKKKANQLIEFQDSINNNKFELDYSNYQGINKYSI